MLAPDIAYEVINGVKTLKFRNSVKILQTVNQVFYSSVQNSIINMKAVPQTHFEIPCTQDFLIWFSKGYN